MLGRQDRSQEMLFVACPLRELIPGDHILKRVDKVLDLTWLRDEVRGLYCEDNGRPGIDPEAAVRLMLAGYFHGIVQDRKLLREAQVNLAIRWFGGYQLHEELPDHSSLTRIRQRWGAERFKRIFQKTVEQCIEAGLVSGETVHVDATLIRADVSWESLTVGHAEQVLSENEAGDDDPDGTGGAKRKSGRPWKQELPGKKFSPTDPDATMATSCRQFHLEPTYKQHTAVDDTAGVIVDVEVTTGEASEGRELAAQIGRVEAATGRRPNAVTADAAYADSANYRHCEDCGMRAVIPPQAERKSGPVPIRRFKYDALHQRVRCPGGHVLRRSSRCKNGWMYRAKGCDCRSCPLRETCVPASAKVRTILIVDGYEALLRARRRWARGDEQMRDLHRRHRWRVEGVHGEAKTQHGLRRAVRRGLWNVAVQAYLTAAVMNLKRLAALLWRLLVARSTRSTSRRELTTIGGHDRIAIGPLSGNSNPMRLAA